MHDEQHLVVLIRQRMLRIEQLVEMQVLPVAQRVSLRSQWTSSSLRSTNGLTGGVASLHA